MRAPLACLLLGACATVQGPPVLEQRAAMPAAVQAETTLTAATILERAHEAAGGETWVRPGSLFLEGFNIIRSPDGGEIVWDRYAMWRVFGDAKPDSRTAEGKVRIEAWTGDELALLISYDGSRTYTQNGPMEDQSANAMWGANFGFGAIRNALDEGWMQRRRPDRLIDNAPTYMIALTDPSGGETLFGIRQSDFRIVYVGFDTPRGWHERYYSHFFTKPGVDWVQPGRVRLVYDGVKANEAVWTDFSIGGAFDNKVFVINAAPEEPTFQARTNADFDG